MKRQFFFILVAGLLFNSCEKVYFNNKPDSPQHVFDAFWYQVDRNFSFFPYLNLNWDSVRTVYEKQINPYMSSQTLASVMGNMIKLLKDGHSDLFTNKGLYYYSGWYTPYPLNQLPSIKSYLSYLTTNDDNIYYGKLRSANLGYIYIKTFEGDDSSQYAVIDQILTDFSTTDGLIIDVRSNGGGNVDNAITIAKRFTDSVRYICKDRYRNGPGHNDFTPWINRYSSTGGKVHYKKPVAVLTNRLCYSATSYFLLEMTVLPQVVIIGDTTGGGSAQPITRELPNGWIVRISNSQRIIPSGRDYQYTGLYPDIPVWISDQDASKGKDRILERAITELTKK